MAERILAHVEKITDIQPINGADNIVVTTVLGWKVIVRKDEGYHIGDSVIYIEIDSRLPSDAEWASFLAGRNYKVKTIKLRGQVSQGLILPVSLLKNPAAKIGTDVSKELGITKIQDDYVAPVVSNDIRLKSKHPKLFKKPWFKFLMKFYGFRLFAYKILLRKTPKTSRFPDWFEHISKTDETRIQNAPELLANKTPMVVTEKLEGTSATYILERVKKNKTKFYVCSRNVCQTSENKQCYYDENVYWIVAKEKLIREKLEEYLSNSQEKYVCLQGEITGPKICGNIYEFSDYHFNVFNFITSTNGRYETLAAKTIVNDLGLEFVPILDTNFILPDTVEEMLNYAEGNSVLHPTLREGVVVRSPSFKAVSNKYLLKKAKKEEA